MKQCKKEGCNNPVFSHLYCRNHQYLRTDDKKPKGLNRKREPTGELEMFRVLWDEREHVCGVCGDYIEEFSRLIFTIKNPREGFLN